MELSATHSFSAPPSQVYAMLCDPRFRAEAARAIGGRDIVPSNHGVRAAIPAPTEVRPFTGALLTFEQTLLWDPPVSDDGSRQGRLTIDVIGLPAGFVGVADLAPDRDGTRVHYAGHFTVKVPLMGRKLEQAAAPTIQESIDRQQETGIWWLANQAR